MNRKCKALNWIFVHKIQQIIKTIRNKIKENLVTGHCISIGRV